MLHTPDTQATSPLVQQNRDETNIWNFFISNKWMFIAHVFIAMDDRHAKRQHWLQFGEEVFTLFINEQITHRQEISKSANFGTTVHAEHLTQPNLAEFEPGCQYGVWPTNDCASVSISTQWWCLPCNVVQTSSQVSTVTLKDRLFFYGLPHAASNFFLLNTQRNWISHLSDFTLIFQPVQRTTDRQSLFRLSSLISQQLYW